MPKGTRGWLERWSGALRGATHASAGTAFIILLEILLLSLLSTGKYYHLSTAGHASLRALVWLPLPIKAVAGAVAITFLAELLRSFGATPRALSPVRTHESDPRRGWWLLNALCVVSLAPILASFEHSWDAGPSLTRLGLVLFLATPVLWVGVIASWVAITAHSTTSVGRSGSFLLLATLAAAFLLDAGVASGVGALLLPATLSLVQLMLGPAGVTLLNFPSSAEGFPIVGTPAFQVEINPPCAGYQGILLSLILVSTCLYFLRPQVTAPRVAAVLLTSVAALYLLNALRIAILIVIGSHYSPDVAMLGFHTNFGLLSALVVSLLSVALLMPSPRSARVPSQAGRTAIQDNVLAGTEYLLPLTLLLAASLITGLLTGSFNWLYPVPIVAAAVGLFLIWDQVAPEFGEGRLRAVLAGVAAFAAWITLIPDDPATSTAFEETLLSASLWIAAPWLIVRILGSVVIVPVAEELAFRGFGVIAVSRLLDKRLPSLWVNVAALFVTSAVYGAVHSHIIAASVAGSIYGAVRLWTGRVWDAIVAHAVSNALLALYVLLFSVWSYW